MTASQRNLVPDRLVGLLALVRVERAQAARIGQERLAEREILHPGRADGRERRAVHGRVDAGPDRGRGVLRAAAREDRRARQREDRAHLREHARHDASRAPVTRSGRAPSPGNASSATFDAAHAQSPSPSCRDRRAAPRSSRCTVQRPMLGPDPYPSASPPEQTVAASFGPANAWLAQHPAVATAVVWETDRGAIPWASWDQAARRELEDAYAAELVALQGKGEGFSVLDPPQNVAAYTSRTLTVLAPRDAFRLYVAYVGHSLALEALRVVPWSIAADTPESLAALLDGRSMFSYRGELGGYLVDPLRSGYVVPGRRRWSSLS